MTSTGSPVPDARPASYPANDSVEALLAAAADPGLNEALALALLRQTALPSAAIEVLVKNRAVARGRKVQRALLLHRHTPRQVWLPFVRNMATLELAVVALSPTVPAEVQRACEEAVIVRVKTISLGERKTLARRSTSRLAGALLLDKEERIMQAALANPQMTEVSIVKALKAGHGTELLAPAVSRHQKWSYRNDVKAALLGNKDTPSGRLIHLAAELPINLIKDVLRSGRLSTQAKNSLIAVLEKRGVRA